jgi:hypothetical protein
VGRQRYETDRQQGVGLAGDQNPQRRVAGHAVDPHHHRDADRVNDRNNCRTGDRAGDQRH